MSNWGVDAPWIVTEPEKTIEDLNMNPFKIGDKTIIYDSGYSEKPTDGFWSVTKVQRQWVWVAGYSEDSEAIHYKTCELVKEPREFFISKNTFKWATVQGLVLGPKTNNTDTTDLYVAYTSRPDSLDYIHVREVIE